MKKIIVAVVAAAAGFSAIARLSQEDIEKIKQAKARIEAMPPAEREAWRWKRQMKKYGGWLTKEGSGGGRVAYVNTTKRVDTVWLKKAVYEIEDLLQVSVVAIGSDAKVSVANADKELMRSKSEAAIFLVEDPTLPVMLIAPESDWAILNVAALAADKPDDKKFLFRVEKEVWRTFGHLCGAADSAMGGCVLSPISSTDDLDALTSKFICPEPLGAIRNHLIHIGVKPYHRTTYLEACQEGWAHQPTNEYQQAIWDKVHKAPTSPLVIAPEKTKQK